MSGVTVASMEPTCLRAREILDSLKQQREEITQRAFLAFGATTTTSTPNSLSTCPEKTVWRTTGTTSTTPSYEVNVVMSPTMMKKKSVDCEPQSSSPLSSSSRSYALHEVVKERRENLLDMLKAASSCRTVNSNQGSQRSGGTGCTDEMSAESPEDTQTSHSSTSDAWGLVSPWLETKGTVSFTDESSSASTADIRHVILLPELMPSPTPAAKRWTREEFCLPRELCWSMTATELAPNPANGPRPQSKISLRGRYVSPSQVIAKRLGLGQHRLGLGQHRLRNGSIARKKTPTIVNNSKSNNSNNKPPVVVVFQNEIVDDHQKRNMMLRSMMLDIIFLRRQYAQLDAKRVAAAKQNPSSSNKKYGLWGPYAKCFLSDEVSLACTSDSDTSGWYTDDDSTAAGTYGVDFSVAKKWMATQATSPSGTAAKKSKKPAFTPPSAVTTRAMAHSPEEHHAMVEYSLSGLPSVDEEEYGDDDDEEDWMMPEDMSDQICGAYGGMYFLYKKQRRVRLSTIVEV